MKKLYSVVLFLLLVAAGLVWRGALWTAAAPQVSAQGLGKGKPADSPVIDGAFWKVWGDGAAELSSYDLTYPRYGANRKGTAVAIFVSETFSNTMRVKADPGVHPKSDEFPVMKLNLVEDFQTGIYDYNMMLSTFVALAPVNGFPAGTPTKISWSSQEWCGNLYKQALFDQDGIDITSHSYFDTEGDQQRKFDQPNGAVSEDALLLWARGMARPVLKPGESRKVPVMLALQSARFKNGPVKFGEATLARSATRQKVKFGTVMVEAEELTATFNDGRKRTFVVETAEPRRILSYSSSEGLRAELLASERMKYWELNKVGGEAALQKLKLRLRPARTM